MIRKHGGRSLVEIYGDSAAGLLTQYFPELVLWKFKTLPRSTWSQLETGIGKNI